MKAAHRAVGRRARPRQPVIPTQRATAPAPHPGDLGSALAAVRLMARGQDGGPWRALLAHLTDLDVTVDYLRRALADVEGKRMDEDELVHEVTFFSPDRPVENGTVLIYPTEDDTAEGDLP